MFGLLTHTAGHYLGDISTTLPLMHVSCSPMEDVKEMGTTLKLWRSAMRGVLVSNALLVN